MTNYNPADRAIKMAELSVLTGLSRSTLYEKLRPKSPYFDPDFPQPIKLGARRVGYSEQAVVAWLKSRSSVCPTDNSQEVISSRQQTLI